MPKSTRVLRSLTHLFLGWEAMQRAIRQQMVPPTVSAKVVRYSIWSGRPRFRWMGTPSDFWNNFCSSGTLFFPVKSYAVESEVNLVGVANMIGGASVETTGFNPCGLQASEAHAPANFCVKPLNLQYMSPCVWLPTAVAWATAPEKAICNVFDESHLTVISVHC